MMIDFHLAQGLANAASPAGKAIAALGISHKQLEDAMRKTGDLMELMRAKFSQYQDGPNKTALAHALLGRSMQELLPILNITKEEFEAYRERLDAMGADMSGPMLEAAAKTGKGRDNARGAGRYYVPALTMSTSGSRYGEGQRPWWPAALRSIVGHSSGALTFRGRDNARDAGRCSHPRAAWLTRVGHSQGCAAWISTQLGEIV